MNLEYNQNDLVSAHLCMPGTDLFPSHRPGDFYPVFMEVFWILLWSQIEHHPRRLVFLIYTNHGRFVPNSFLSSLPALGMNSGDMSASQVLCCWTTSQTLFFFFWDRRRIIMLPRLALNSHFWFRLAWHLWSFCLTLLSSKDYKSTPLGPLSFVIISYECKLTFTFCHIVFTQ